LKLDLQEDQKTLYDYLKKRVQDYSSDTNDGPGAENAPVSFIHRREGATLLTLLTLEEPMLSNRLRTGGSQCPQY
jgi:hypothetical protein